jgi:hypothetical protein
MMTRLMLAAGVVSTLLTAPAMAGSISFYGRNGSYAGAAITRGGYTTYTNARGAYAGSSVTRGRTTTVYDRNGSFAGSSTRTGRR